MKHRPTIEDIIELSGIETLHPGGLLLTRKTAEAAGMKRGSTVLDVACGRGTQAILYAREYGVDVTGIDVSADMLAAAKEKLRQAGMADRVRFRRGDSLALPLRSDSFDIVINECAVGIPDDPQQVLNEMLRVTKPGGRVVIHESLWLQDLPKAEKEAFAALYGTTPFTPSEWRHMLEKAGAVSIESEVEQWSRPENFWKIRQGRDVKDYKSILSLAERIRTLVRVVKEYGPRGMVNALRNERLFWAAVLAGKLGYGLFMGNKAQPPLGSE